MGAVNLPKGTPSGPFASAALELAEAGLAVIPCGSDDGKVPSIKWRNMRYRPGAEFIGKLAKQHGHANVGILTGKLSGVLIVDIDDPEIVDPMLERFGRTPILIRTPSGGVHLWYRWNGEKSGSLRNQGLAVDIKGAGGIVVVPPSVRPRTGRPYTWLKGSLKDLPSLPKARPGSLPLTNERAVPEPLRAITEGRRNNTLFKLLLREVHRCDSRLALQDVAQTINDDCDPPLSDMELTRLVDSVWGYETTGRNWAGKEAMIVFTDGIDPDVSIIKTVNNETDFDWTDFHIELTPNEGEGDLFIYPESVSSDRFSDIEIMNNDDGSAVMWFFTDFDAGDTPVLFGEMATFEYTFNIPGDPDFGYRTIQIPTPEPTSLLLVLAGAALTLRRSRC